MTLLLLAGVFVSAPIASRGQAPVQVTGPAELIVDEDDIHAVGPAWSPNAARPQIAFTSEKYRGLWVKDVAEGSTRTLTDEQAAGFGFAWSDDGHAISTRVARYEGNRRLDAVKIFSPDAVTVHQLADFDGRITSVPAWTEGEEAVVVQYGTTRRRLESPLRGAKTDSERSAAIVAADNAIVRVNADAPEETLARFDNTVLNLAVSPDREWLALEILGGDLFVARSDGSAQTSLGRGSRPAWSPNSEWVVFMQTRDDGHEITSADLMLGTRSGEVWNLTDTPGILEMNPSWSPSGDRIAYDHQGRIYALPVSETGSR